MLPEFGAIPFLALLDEPPTLMWEHQGRCSCGRRSYLFGQCATCLREDRDGRAADAAEIAEWRDIATEAAAEYRSECAAKAQEQTTIEVQCSRVCQDPWPPAQPDQQALSTASAPIIPALPDTLQHPDVRLGRQTRHVEFITDTVIQNILGKNPGQSLSLIHISEPTRPY